MVLFVELLPDRQFFAADSPRGPVEDQHATATEITQPVGGLAVKRRYCKIRGGFADFDFLRIPRNNVHDDQYSSQKEQF